MSTNEGNTKAPVVSIGLPVYNGEKYLERSIDSIGTGTHPVAQSWITQTSSTEPRAHAAAVGACRAVSEACLGRLA